MNKQHSNHANVLAMTKQIEKPTKTQNDKNSTIGSQ